MLFTRNVLLGVSVKDTVHNLDADYSNALTDIFDLDILRVVGKEVGVQFDTSVVDEVEGVGLGDVNSVLVEHLQDTQHAELETLPFNESLHIFLNISFVAQICGLVKELVGVELQKMLVYVFFMVRTMANGLQHVQPAGEGFDFL